MRAEFEEFLNAFFAGLQGKKIEISEEKIERVRYYSRINSVSAITYAGIKNVQPDNAEFAEFRKEALASCSRQIILGEILSRFLRELENRSVFYCVVKGPAVAVYYISPDMRSSSDIDILIDRSQFDEVKKAVAEFGVILDNKMSDDCVHAMLEGCLHIEIHMELYGGSVTPKELFSLEALTASNSFEQVSVGDSTIMTLSPQTHLLYLICHCAEHFVNAGCGVRQLADCWIYADANRNRIDFEKAFSVLRKYSLEIFAKTVFAVGIIYGGADSEILPEDAEKFRSVAEKMLDDAVDGGSFGHSNAERAATTTLTKTGKMSLTDAIFPPVDYLKKRYPECAKNSLLIPVAWLKRIIEFLTNKNRTSGNPLEQINRTVQIAQERKKLIDSLGVFNRQAASVETVAVENMLEHLENGNRVKIRISGNSMAPFLKDGRDFVILEKFSGRPVRGGIYFYRRPGGKAVMHRLVRINRGKLYMCGDSQLTIETGITEEMFFASAEEFIIDGKRVTKHSLKYKFYAHVWSRIKLRKLIFKVLAWIRK